MIFLKAINFIHKSKIYYSILIEVFLGILIPILNPLKDYIVFSISKRNHSIGVIRNDRYINDFEISPNGRHIVTAGSFLTSSGVKHGLKVWSIKSLETTRSIISDDFEINDIAFLENGSKIASAHSNGDIKIWNFQSGKFLQKFSVSGQSTENIQLSKTGLIIASYDVGVPQASKKQNLRAWDLNSKSSLCTFDFESPVNFAPNPIGESTVAYSIIGGLRKLNLKDCKKVQSYNINSWKMEGELYNSGSFILFKNDGRSFFSDVSNNIEIWNDNSPDSVGKLVGHKDGILSAVISSDDNTLISSSEDNSIKIWDLNQKTTLHTFRLDSSYLKQLVLSPDGKILLTRDVGNTIRLWKIP